MAMKERGNGLGERETEWRERGGGESVDERERERKQLLLAQPCMHASSRPPPKAGRLAPTNSTLTISQKLILRQVNLHTNMCSALVDMFMDKLAARGFRDIPGHPTGGRLHPDPSLHGSDS